MPTNFKGYALLALTIAVGVAAGFKLNELINKAKMPVASSDK